jgi:hypothetical protein
MSDMSCLKARVVAACGSASTAEDYHAAKRLAGRLNLVTQFAVIDNLISCRRRLEGVGVL